MSPDQTQIDTAFEYARRSQTGDGATPYSYNTDFVEWFDRFAGLFDRIDYYHEQ